MSRRSVLVCIRKSPLNKGDVWSFLRMTSWLFKGHLCSSFTFDLIFCCCFVCCFFCGTHSYSAILFLVILSFLKSPTKIVCVLYSFLQILIKPYSVLFSHTHSFFSDQYYPSFLLFFLVDLECLHPFFTGLNNGLTFDSVNRVIFGYLKHEPRKTALCII